MSVLSWRGGSAQASIPVLLETKQYMRAGPTLLSGERVSNTHTQADMQAAAARQSQ